MNTSSKQSTCDRTENTFSNDSTNSRGPKSIRICTQCNKPLNTIISPASYTYKKTVDKRRVYFCSWNCMRTYERA